MTQYCSKFHTEHICPTCDSFNIKGIIFCLTCGASLSQDLSSMKESTMTAQDQVNFTNAELRTLVWKENNKWRGTITDPYQLKLLRARKHLERAQKGVPQLDGSLKSFRNCAHRWDCDEQYRLRLQQDENLTREDVEEYDYLASLPRKDMPFSLEDRQARRKDKAWKLVQAKGGGSSTVQTSAYPTYQGMQAAKAAAPAPYSQPSSSTSWNQSDQWWSQAWQPEPEQWWSDDTWSQRKW